MSEYPCHKLPEEQWCDHAGRGGFMGHTCVKPKPKPKVKVTSFELKTALLEYYRFRRQCICVDEFNGADVIVDTGKDIIEVEVKVNRGDLCRGERQKVRKHACYRRGSQFAQCHPNRFMFCVPLSLKEIAEEMVAELNPKYGIITFDVERYFADVSRGYGTILSNYLCTVKRAGRLHTGYALRQQLLIAKRCSAKLVTLMQNQHKDRLVSTRLKMLTQK